jgi:hypothetical protein
MYLMRYFLLTTLFSLIASIGCDGRPVIIDNELQTAPIHLKPDAELQFYEAQYEILAFLHGICIENHVTMGFSDIRIKKKKGRGIVGLCMYGKNFREIDIDYDYWQKQSMLGRQTLIFHEMTHCLCGRMHDWDYNTPYPEPGSNEPDSLDVNKIVTINPMVDTKGLANGFLNDECPMSIMYPYVVSDGCMQKHLKMYLDEMFDRCQPY